MNRILTRIKVLFVPYIVLCIAFVAAYTVLNWLLFVQFHAIDLREDIVDLWLPLLFGLTVSFLGLNKQTDLIALTKRSKNRGVNFSAAAALIVWITTAATQAYVRSACGGVTHLTDITHLHDQKSTQNYTVDHCFIGNDLASFYTERNTSGKGNPDLNFIFYAVIPLCKDSIKGTTYEPATWLAVTYRQTISNKLDHYRKDTLYGHFIDSCIAHVHNVDYSHFNYLERVGNNSDHDGYKKAIADNKWNHNTEGTLLHPLYEPLEEQNRKLLIITLVVFGAGTLLMLIITCFTKLDEDAVKIKYSGMGKLL